MIKPTALLAMALLTTKLCIAVPTLENDCKRDIVGYLDGLKRYENYRDSV